MRGARHAGGRSCGTQSAMDGGRRDNQRVTMMDSENSSAPDEVEHVVVSGADLPLARVRPSCAGEREPRRHFQDPRRIPPQPHPPRRLSSFGQMAGRPSRCPRRIGGWSRDHQQRRAPRAGTRRAPAPPTSTCPAPVRAGSGRRSRSRVLAGTASGCGTCPNPGGGPARCRSSPLLTAPASAGACTA
jgi:hypothetical protein